MPFQNPTFVYLFRLHIRIAFRYLKRLHKEIAALIIVAEGIDILGANNVEQSFPQVAFSAYCVLAFVLQIYRKDKKFLRVAIDDYRKFLVFENLLIVLPFALILVAYKNWVLVISSVLIAIFAGFIEWKPIRSVGIRIGGFLPDGAFEWQAGIRQRVINFIVIYAIGSLGVLNASLSLLSVLFLAYNVASFYGPCESYLMIDGFASTNSFLGRKLKQSVSLFLCFAAPLIILTLLKMRFEHWWVIAVVLCICMIIVVGSLLIKYAHFEEGKNQSAQNDVRLILLTASIAFVPVTLAYEWRLYRKIKLHLPMYSHRNYSHA